MSRGRMRCHAGDEEDLVPEAACRTAIELTLAKPRQTLDSKINVGILKTAPRPRPYREALARYARIVTSCDEPEQPFLLV